MEKRRKIGKYIPPAFFVMLAVAGAMWWLTQLGKTYDRVEIPVEVKVEGNIFTVRCLAQGVGYKLLVHRTVGRSTVEVAFGELDVKPSPDNKGMGVIAPEALQAAIAHRIADVKIVGIEAVPEISLDGR